ncbi:sugar nucleotide-binding protein [Lentibacillus sediminis]|uniref:sugar nucleotide-binding protein n=1 Tax=Lentibacillus sediminis TaxID=1940529 RepID=UPI000C1BC621|nr:sugar nucleotide-binding protein [Lentibacillus sediminis]
MKICVFGASGYVGASVYQLLKKPDGVDVSGTTLEDAPLFEELDILDINEPESFSDYFKRENPDVVIWLVQGGPEEHSLTTQGLMHVITFLRPETKLIYISTDLVFSGGKGPYKEEDPISSLPDDHALRHYTNAKVKAERYIENELTNYVILRAGPTYGENLIGKLDERTDKLAYHLRTGKEISYRDDLIRTFVHVEDFANVIVEMAQNDLTGVFHAGPDVQQSFYTFMQGMAEQQGFDGNFVQKAPEEEEPDTEVPKNTSLFTDKIKNKVNQTFR